GSSFLNTVEAYRLGPNSWSAVASMSGARAGAAAAAGLDGRVYAFGGFDGSGIVNSAEAYNPMTNTWTTVAGMSSPRLFAAAALGVNGRIYAFGGFNNIGFLTSMEVLQISSGLFGRAAPGARIPSLSMTRLSKRSSQPRPLSRRSWNETLARMSAATSACDTGR